VAKSAYNAKRNQPTNKQSFVVLYACSSKRATLLQIGLPLVLPLLGIGLNTVEQHEQPQRKSDQKQRGKQF